MTEFDLQRITAWIRDGFAILCVRANGGSAAEHQVRLGFEGILRELGTPPLRLLARSLPVPVRVVGASSTDWRQIISALDRCLAVFQRYDPLLNARLRRTRDLIAATRSFAQEQLRSEIARRAAAAPPLAAAVPAAASTAL